MLREWHHSLPRWAASVVPRSAIGRMLRRPLSSRRADCCALLYDHHDPKRMAIELIPPETEVPTDVHQPGRRFAARLAVFYGDTFALGGPPLPFFPVWLKAVGIDPAWIGVIMAVPSVTRFTTLPL